LTAAEEPLLTPSTLALTLSDKEREAVDEADAEKGISAATR
jgi:hypothetical protein